MLKVLLTLVALAGVTTVHAADEKPFGERSLMSESNIAERVSRAGTICLKGEACAGQVVKSGADAAASTEKGEADTAVETAESSAPRSGDAVYNTFCTTCHGAGVAGAPKLGDAAAWQEKLEAHGGNVEALWKSGWNGKGAMPPKGMCADCTEEEFSAAVTYMLDSSK